MAAGGAVGEERRGDVAPVGELEEAPITVQEGELDPFVRHTFEDSPIGEYLRRQRTLRGVSLQELSSATRIPLRSLERLEGGEFDGETDGFVRGFVRTVAVALGLDAEDAVSRVLEEPTHGAWERQPASRRVKQRFAALFLVALAAVGYLIFQSVWDMLLGSAADDSDRELVLWRDPVRTLAETAGIEVDPAAEINPGLGTLASGRPEQVVQPAESGER